MAVARWMTAAWALPLLVLASSCRGAPAVRGSAALDASRVMSEVRDRTRADGDTASLATSASSRLAAGPLDVGSAVEIALAFNPTVREGYERLGIARADLVQAGLLANPMLDLGIKRFPAGTEIEGGLVAPVVDLFRMPIRRRIAASRQRAVEAEVARDVVGLVYDVRRAFLVVHEARAIVKLRSDALEAAKASLSLMESLHDAGNTLDQNRTIEAIGAARAALDLEAARSDEAEAVEDLVRLLALEEPPGALEIEGALGTAPGEGLDVADLAARAEGASWDLRALDAAVCAARQDAALVTRDRAMWLRDAGLVGKRDHGESAVGVGPHVGLELPVFDSGRTARARSAAVVRQLLAQRDARRLDVRSAARRLEARVRLLLDRERVLREQYLPERNQLVKDILDRYSMMQVGAFEVLEAKGHELDARREHVQTLAAAWRARLDVEELLAGRLNDGMVSRAGLPMEPEHPHTAGGH
ncbi:MAG: TolC family protein [Dehalococcoidia bacterium]|nr:TolC family protein [Dehalococcoidia bacterium]